MKKNKIFIDERYFPEEEIRTNLKPYESFYKCLNTTFNIENIKNFCDVGCTNGPLLYFVKSNHPNIEVAGYEYFDWLKSSAKELIINDIILHDLRDSIENPKKYDLVNCTETGEHIDPDYLDVFMKNLVSLTGKYLVISWSDSGGENDIVHDQHLQHLSPMKREDVFKLIESYGFKVNIELSNTLINETLKYSDFHFWWRKSLSVFELKN